MVCRRQPPVSHQWADRAWPAALRRGAWRASCRCSAMGFRSRRHRPWTAYLVSPGCPPRR